MKSTPKSTSRSKSKSTSKRTRAGAKNSADKKRSVTKGAVTRGTVRKGSTGKKAAKKSAAKAASARNATSDARASRAQAAADERRQPREALYSILRPDGTILAKHDPKLPREQLLYLYRTMVLVREFDRRMLVLQRQGRIGFYGPIKGQEAATVGSVAAVEERDWIFPALREGAAAMMRGLPLPQVIAQLVGNSLDRCKGRQMPCHYTFKQGHYVSMSSVIGTQISHATGAAMAARIRGDDVVVLGYMGDGATSSSDFHAGMNFAAVFKAPVVMFCQNNQWAISVPVQMQHAAETIAVKGHAYGMPCVRVDGNDVLAVYRVTKDAADRARRGEGPTFIEAVTYRRLGHSSSDDPDRYRDPKETEIWEQRDPIERMKRYLSARKLWSERDEVALNEEIGDEVNAAIKVAEEAPPLPASELIADVFAEIPPGLRAHFEAEIDASAQHGSPPA
ncbi:MAG: thiamine pyrophosphate-dependent dehydrogenase E1 component subunit alpha [Planctomycetota bacterium]